MYRTRNMAMHGFGTMYEGIFCNLFADVDRIETCVRDKYSGGNLDFKVIKQLIEHPIADNNEFAKCVTNTEDFTLCDSTS